MQSVKCHEIHVQVVVHLPIYQILAHCPLLEAAREAVEGMRQLLCATRLLPHQAVHVRSPHENSSSLDFGLSPC